MEEKKEKKKFNKKPLLICLAIALVFAIVGFIDIKSNAAESNNSISFYLSAYNSKNNTGTLQVASKHKYVVNGQNDMEVFYIQSHTEETSTEVTFARAYVVSKYPMTRADYTIGTNESNMGQEYFDGSFSSMEYTINGQTFYVVQVSRTLMNTGNGSWSGYVGLEFDTPFPKTKVSRLYEPDEFAQAYANDYLDKVYDYTNFVASDDLPIVQNLEFDRIEISENKTVNTVRTVTDYLRFEPNNDYKLMIMVCPSVYSTFGSDSFIGKFDNFEYSSWVFMCISDFNLKEISCDLGVFEVPTYDMSDIISSDYYSYYNEILKTFNGNTGGVIKPTMGYRLAYVDEKNGLIGPSTYIKPLSYDHLNPDFETYSYFTLYTDGTRNTEKIMNMKTWTSVYDASDGDGYYEDFKEEIKETIVNVQDVLKDYTIVDNDVDVKEATNWLYSVVGFIKGTPGVIGSVLGFLPKPILYGMYVCIFLGVIASGVAIVKALI